MSTNIPKQLQKSNEKPRLFLLEIRTDGKTFEVINCNQLYSEDDFVSDT
jgi:hypothetical protein